MTQAFEDAVRQALTVAPGTFSAVEEVRKMTKQSAEDKARLEAAAKAFMEAETNKIAQQFLEQQYDVTPQPVEMTPEQLKKAEEMMNTLTQTTQIVPSAPVVVTATPTPATPAKKDTAMPVVAVAKKMDKNKAQLVRAVDDRVWVKGCTLYAPVFEQYEKGKLLVVTFTFSSKGRRMVKEVREYVHGQDATVGVAVTSTPESAEPKPTTKKVKVKKSLNGYFINQEARTTFTTAKMMSDNNPDKAVKIMMVGPSGYGKTTLPKIFSEVTGMDFFRMNCATVRDPEEWFGFREARENSTVFIKSEFARQIEKGNTVVVLDEFNRLEPWLHNTLFPLLDDDGRTIVHDEEFVIGPNVIVVGTINTGYKYTGTFELDEALLNRFDFMLEVGPMPFDEEVKVLVERTGIAVDTAKGIVKLATTVRAQGVVCSTRTSLLMSRMVASGMVIREAVESAVVRRLPTESGSNLIRKAVVDAVNAQIGPYTPRTMSNDVFEQEIEIEVQEKVETVEEPEGRLVPTFILKKGTGTWEGVAALRALQALPIEIVGTGVAMMSMAQARGIVDRLVEGNIIAIPLHKSLSREKVLELAAGLKECGIAGQYGQRTHTPVGSIVTAQFAGFAE